MQEKTVVLHYKPRCSLCKTLEKAMDSKGIYRVMGKQGEYFYTCQYHIAFYGDGYCADITKVMYEEKKIVMSHRPSCLFCELFNPPPYSDNDMFFAESDLYRMFICKDHYQWLELRDVCKHVVGIPVVVT